jgi:prevent-host-death family protein
MEPVNILDARNSLSQLVAAAAQGEDVVIAKRGTPVVRLVPIAAPEISAGGVARWLTMNPPPLRHAPTLEELDESIARERSGWD